MKFAVIGADYMADIIIQRAKKLVVTTYCFAWEKGAVAKESSDCFFPVSVTEKDTIADICHDIKIDGVVAAASVEIPTVSYVAEKLNLLGNPVNVSQHISEKDYMRDKTRNIEGLEQIRYAISSGIEEFSKSEWEYPLIIKPTNPGGKDGIMIVNTADEVEDAFVYAKNHKTLIVEGYIKWQEYSVESLSYKGEHFIIQVTDKENARVLILWHWLIINQLH